MSTLLEFSKNQTNYSNQDYDVSKKRISSIIGKTLPTLNDDQVLCYRNRYDDLKGRDDAYIKFEWSNNGRKTQRNPLCSTKVSDNIEEIRLFLDNENLNMSLYSVNPLIDDRVMTEIPSFCETIDSCTYNNPYDAGNQIFTNLSKKHIENIGIVKDNNGYHIREGPSSVKNDSQLIKVTLDY